MNRLFNLKASVILFAILFCQTVLRAQSVSQVDTGHVVAKNIDTTLTKKKSSSILVKSDTALIVKAGATILQRADTTMVINADPELIRRFNQIVAAKQQSDQKKADSAATSKQNTFTQLRPDPQPVKKSDSTASSPASVPVSVPAVNAGAATTTVAGAAESVVGGAAKTDASIPAQTNGTNTNSTTNNNQQQSNNTGTTSAGNTTPANKPDSTAANNTAQQTNSTVRTNKADTSSAKKADTNQQNAGNSTPAAKADSALTTKVDTSIAKKDTTIKKSDTTSMKKDTALMVADTAGHVAKAKAYYLEVGGAGLAISANYDSRFHDERNGWGYRIGAGFFSSGGNTVFTIPFQVNYLTGEHSMHVEMGAGVTFLNSTGTNVGNSKWEFDKVTGFIATATIGFRYQPEHKGLNFRIAFVPILYDEGLIPAGGVSIGYTFK